LPELPKNISWRTCENKTLLILNLINKTAFINDKQISYFSNVVGELSISKDKLFISFEKEINETIKETQKSEILTQLTDEAEKTIKNIFNKFHKNG